jgi:hypothetical protein
MPAPFQPRRLRIERGQVAAAQVASGERGAVQPSNMLPTSLQPVKVASKNEQRVKVRWTKPGDRG